MITMSMVRTVLFAAVVIQTVYSFEPCQTPNGGHGECKPLKQCESLYSYFNDGSISSRIATELKRSHCGFSGRQPKVCCPSKTALEDKTLVASSNLLPDANSCGLHTSGKIVGGEVTDLDEFPWMALLEFNNKGTRSFECGGSLINKRYVLTAAHCILDSLVGVRLGEYNTETDPDCVTNSYGTDCAPSAVDFGIEEKIIYKTYDKEDTSRYHDIGLIRLNRDVKYSDFIKPICLPLTADEIYKDYVGQNLTVSGWGLTERDVKSNYKLKVQVPVRTISDCIIDYKKRVNVNLALDAGQICAGGVRGQDACKGDSGGPLMNVRIDKNKDAHFYAVGVVSFGPVPCGQHKLPGVYTKVSKYISWIISKLRP